MKLREYHVPTIPTKSYWTVLGSWLLLSLLHIDFFLFIGIWRIIALIPSIQKIFHFTQVYLTIWDLKQNQMNHRDNCPSITIAHFVTILSVKWQRSWLSVVKYASKCFYKWNILIEASTLAVSYVYLKSY
jgi:hypothetical protein